MAEWRTLSPLLKSAAILATAVFVVGVGYLLITFVLFVLGSLGIGESCKPGC